MPYKPDGYTSLSPYLIVADAEATLRFAREVLGADPLFIHRGPDGAIAHAEARIDDAILMVGQASGGGEVHLHLYVTDVDETYRRALEAGATVVAEIAEKGDGDRRGGVRDPGGTVWWLSTQITPRNGEKSEKTGKTSS